MEGLKSYVIILVVFLIILSSCGNTARTDAGPYSLYRQRIDNSNYVLYEFSYAGIFVTSSDNIGVTILDSTEIFERKKIDKLPHGTFVGKPAIEDMKIITLRYLKETIEKDTLLVPVKEYKQSFNGVEFDIEEYQQTYGISAINMGWLRYNFDTVEETRDSVIFTGVQRIGEYVYRDLPSRAAFCKGNVKVVEDKYKFVDYIQIKETFVGRDAIFTPTNPARRIANQPVVEVARLDFFPREIMRPDVLSDNGIWKRIQ